MNQLYVVVRHDDGEPLHIRRHGWGHAFCGAFIGNQYIVQRPLYRPGAETPTCLRCVGRAMCGSRY